MERWVLGITISVENFVETDSQEGCLHTFLSFGAKKKKKKKNMKKIWQTNYEGYSFQI